jgi:hypothetical protein
MLLMGDCSSSRQSTVDTAVKDDMVVKKKIKSGSVRKKEKGPFPRAQRSCSINNSMLGEGPFLQAAMSRTPHLYKDLTGCEFPTCGLRHSNVYNNNKK